jgi:perosamine synthetase
MDKFIPLSVPNLKGNELRYVTEVIQNEWVSTGGSMITRFEEEFAKYISVSAAAACQSGTAGIHLALRLAGIGYGDEVIVPTLTFIAAVNPVRYVNADPVFMDCDNSLCLDTNKLREFCSSECESVNGVLIHKETNKPIKGIIVVHVFGNMADMESVMQIAEQYNLMVIEDATEALGSYFTGGKYKGRFAGTIGHFGIYSFNGNKIITTGGGGMLVSQDSQMVERARYLSTQAKDDEINFIHNEIGYNYRMTNIQAAIGIAQLEQIETFISTKINNYKIYYDAFFNEENVFLLKFNKNTRSNHWFYSLNLKSGNKDELIKYLAEYNIQSRPIWGLIHEQKPYQEYYKFKIEKSKKYHDSIVNLPCSTNLLENDLYRVIRRIKQFLIK